MYPVSSYAVLCSFDRVPACCIVRVNDRAASGPGLPGVSSAYFEVRGTIREGHVPPFGHHRRPFAQTTNPSKSLWVRKGENLSPRHLERRLSTRCDDLRARKSLAGNGVYDMPPQILRYCAPILLENRERFIKAFGKQRSNRCQMPEKIMVSV